MKKDPIMIDGLPSAGKTELDSLTDPIDSEKLLHDVRSLVERSRLRLAQSVNSELVLLYWRVGRRIREEIITEDRADYGKRVVEALSDSLKSEYGSGFGRRNLFNMIRFAEDYQDPEIVQTLSAQLSWSHFIEIIYLKDPLQRQFYAEMARVERWSVRTLRKKIQGMLYERTAISRKPEVLARQELEALSEEDRMTPDLVFRDPYLLDFLGLEDTYSERDLEAAILRELERFLLELGTDFSFIARQKRMTIGDRDFYLDLLFYHRSLRRLVAIELKLGSFDPAHKGQMELYLRWLDRYERRPGEDMPIGLILCGEKNREQIELLQLDLGEIRVAEYLVELPPKGLLEAKLHEAIRLARGQVDLREEKREDEIPRINP
jgi:predicted nuclease of restriction endonuclease-like (RecB) superfamily